MQVQDRRQVDQSAEDQDPAAPLRGSRRLVTARTPSSETTEKCEILPFKTGTGAAVV